MAYGDFNNDGKMDLLVMTLDGAPHLLRNVGGAKNHWLTVVPKLSNGKTDAIGAGHGEDRRVGANPRCDSGNRLPVQSDPRPHFGLAKATKADVVEIRWPNGRVTTLKDVRADQFLKVVQEKLYTPEVRTMKKATGICVLAVLLPAPLFLTRIPPPLPAAEPAAQPAVEPKESYSGVTATEPAPGRRSTWGRVCAACHEGRQQGDQLSRWLLSKHSRAYAVLARPESKQIAELSGVPLEPQRSTMCLGCHATGTFAEASEKDDTFFAEDGVQCEMCHGPGSEHAEAQAAMDAAAVARGGECSAARPAHLGAAEGSPRGAAGRVAEAIAARVPGLPQREGIAHASAETAGHRHEQGMGQHLPPHAAGLGPASAAQAIGACRRPARRPAIYRRDGLRQVPPGSKPGIPVQPVADEQACAGLCRTVFVYRLCDGQEGGRRGRSGAEPPMPEVPCHGLS